MTDEKAMDILKEELSNMSPECQEAVIYLCLRYSNLVHWLGGVVDKIEVICDTLEEKSKNNGR